MTGGNLPRLLLGAPHSGGGKTTVTCAILQALVNRGMTPAAFKCGPDYIDPMFHSEIIGAKSRNLDLFFMGDNTAKRLLFENGTGCDLSLIEGVMGYYDGVAFSADASAYAVSKVTDTPSVLVVDGRGSALSVAALVGGFQNFRPDSGLMGVVLNRVNPMLYPRLKACIEGETGLTVYGFLPELPECAFESRHLGLITASEVENLKEKLQMLAQAAERTLDLDGLLSLARSAPPLAFGAEPPFKKVTNRPEIGVARDDAFCFYYADGLRLLEELGAELVPFSPLIDKTLPADCAALYLGGGYPELFAKVLSENKGMRGAIRAAILGGMPTVAECGGFLYLHETLEGADGVSYPMAGVIPSQGVRGKKLQNFGYVTLTAQNDNLLCTAGETMPAHEFHYWQSGSDGVDFRAEKPQSDRIWDCVHATETLYAGFPHLHFSACPKAAERFVSAAGRYKEEQL